MAKEKYDDWELDSDVDTLIKANELLNDGVKLPKIKKRFAEKQEALSDTAKQLALDCKICDKVAVCFPCFLPGDDAPAIWSGLPEI